jgi:PDZ domain-containing protein
VAAAVLWFWPSDRYLFLPHPARDVDSLVSVPGESTEPEENGIYMVDILVRRASLLERILPDIREGSTLVPPEAVNPTGVSDTQRRRESLHQMSRSQEVAVAVALRELGHDVDATPAGAEVTAVFADAPAQGKLEAGDVVVAAQGRRVRTPGDLRAIMAQHPPGQPVAWRVRRSGGTREVRLETEAAPEEPDRAVVGVLVAQAADIDLPVAVRIDAGDIGGPSAGLAFALDVVDELGDDIDGDRRIAVTGELELDGDILAVGGIKQKTIGARLGEADIFLVPDDNAAEARRYADGLAVIPVSTFEEALSALARG